MSTLQLKDFFELLGCAAQSVYPLARAVGRVYFSFENSRAAMAEEIVQNSPFIHLDGISEVPGWELLMEAELSGL